MVIYCDRNDGIFTPQMSDRINIKSDLLYDKINSIETKPVYPYIDIRPEKINQTAATSVGVDYIVDDSLRLGNSLHVVNVSMRFTNSRSFDSFTTVGNLIVAPITDIVLQYNDGQYFILVEKGTTAIKCYGNPGFTLAFYFFYIV